MIFLTVASHHEFIEHATALICHEVVLNDVPRIALAGGHTPKDVYSSLSTKAMDFSKAHFYLVDERYVPHDNPESNTYLIQHNFSNKVDTHFHPIPYLSTPESSAEAYELTLGNSNFDLCVLGIGEDGHIASLFPCTFQNPIPKKKVFQTHSPLPPTERISLSPDMIVHSSKILVLLDGPSKKEVFEQLQGKVNDPKKFPASILKKHPDCTVLYCPE